jgi:RNA-directed DNA polymerase
MKKQQKITGKLPVSASSTAWGSINWQKVTVKVHRLQMRIAKAAKQQRHNKVKALQCC